MRIKGEDERIYSIYIDANLNNPMMPDNLKLRFKNSVVPTDADAVLLTHMNLT